MSEPKKMPAACAALALLALCLHGAREAGAELWGPRSVALQDGLGGEIASDAWPSDFLGLLVVAGDFNGDGRDDLAVYEQDSFTDQREGAVHILYSPTLDGSPPDLLLRDVIPSTGVNDRESFDFFGAALAVGDFDGNGFEDLAVGIPGDTFVPAGGGGGGGVGAVNVYYGSLSGLSLVGSPPGRRFRIGLGGIGGTPNPGDLFGSELAAGDFDGDGRDDLAIGIPYREVDDVTDAGSVLVLYGGASGLDTADRRFFNQNLAGADGEMQDLSEATDRFGGELVCGDFNGDSLADLAIGVPFEDIGTAENAGVVQVLYGFSSPGPRGLRLTNNQAWNDGNIGTPSVVEEGDEFGRTLAAGRLVGDDADDLAIGVPSEDLNGFQSAGEVKLLRGDLSIGLSTAGSMLISKLIVGGSEPIEPFDSFGSTLAIGDLLGNESDLNDLAIGISGEDALVGGVPALSVGVLLIVKGSGAELDPDDNRFWRPGYRGSAGVDDGAVHYPYSPVVGDFDGDGHQDLASGTPFRNGTNPVGDPSSRSGGLYILFGALFADGFETGASDLWSGTTP
jgi:hypothetical protein